MKYIFISTTIFSWLIFALGAIAQELPKCSPKKSDFVGEDIKTYSVDWGFNRNPGRGGENYGADYWVPDPGRPHHVNKQSIFSIEIKVMSLTLAYCEKFRRSLWSLKNNQTRNPDFFVSS